MTAKASVAGAAPLTPHPWTLYLGDCIEGMRELPDKSVDHFVCDPPYRRDLYLGFRTNAGARGHSLGARNRRFGHESKAHLELANMAIGSADDLAAPAVAEMLRLSRRWMVIFHDAEGGEMWRTPLGAAHIRCGVWVKTNPVPQISGDRPAQGYEAIEIAHGPGRKRWNGGGRPAVWTAGALQGNWGERVGNPHPCPKPLEIMEGLIRDFTDPGDLVCDPFAGSGTTGVACIRLGRRFLGWEKDPNFHAVAVKRLSAARQHYELLPRPAKPKQQGLGFTSVEAPQALSNSSRPADPEEAA